MKHGRSSNRIWPETGPESAGWTTPRIISGIVHVFKLGCWWCVCPADYCPVTSVHNRFNGGLRRGVWSKSVDELEQAAAVPKSTAFDSTHIKAQRAGFGAKRGGRSRPSGRLPRGGWTTKIHALTDIIGRPCALMLMAGNVSDVTAAPALVERAGPMHYLWGDKGYDADSLRLSLEHGRTAPVTPGRRNRKTPTRYDLPRYRECHLIENAVCGIKYFLRIAARHDRMAAEISFGRGVGHCHLILALRHETCSTL